jgi:geranylgeranyl pyrophosphate synthase
MDARAELAGLDVPAFIRSNFEYAVLEHPQPSYMLLPMVFLATADHLGGVTDRHRRYLPTYMLTMELAAMLDDTVDRTAYRSGRVTYHHRYGTRSATAFSCYLLNTVLLETAKVAPEVVSLVTDLFGQLCALETWECHARYPDPTPDVCSPWLRLHYDEVTPAVAHGLDAALFLHGKGRLPAEVSTRFSHIMQDVDDVVNLVERREQAGENDDIKMGIVTYPLLTVLRDDPRMVDRARFVWRRYREAAEAEDLTEAFRKADQDAAPDYAPLVEAMRRVGVPATVEKIVADAEACVLAAPEELQPCIREIVLSFVDRLRHLRGEPDGLIAA